MNKLMTPKEVAEMLGIKLCTVYQWTSQKKIPHLKVGSLVRFDRKVLTDWLAANHCEPYRFDATGILSSGRIQRVRAS